VGGSCLVGSRWCLVKRHAQAVEGKKKKGWLAKGFRGGKRVFVGKKVSRKNDGQKGVGGGGAKIGVGGLVLSPSIVGRGERGKTWRKG